eukprot:4943558-Prymnesium_polylepis.2
MALTLRRSYGTCRVLSRDIKGPRETPLQTFKLSPNQRSQARAMGMAPSAETAVHDVSMSHSAPASTHGH